jgi:S-adenosylmethionine:tRNA ribosyltransferase-isomerase
VEALFLVNEWRGGPIPAMANTKVTVGGKLFLDKNRFFTATTQDKNIFYLKPNFPVKEVLEILNKRGVMPVPKYIKNSGLSEKELRQKYQTIFGKKSASVAAPTASLHFTNRLFKKLDQEGIKKTFITLDLGLGTFSPISPENLAKGKLHTEFLNIPVSSARLIRKYKKENQPIVAVGTTAIRALETEANKILSNVDRPIIDATQIFIRPPYKFKIADAMITNFHLPSTSLMMLVQAFLSHKKAKQTLTDLYQMAIREKFRFYSFGDAMLIK